MKRHPTLQPLSRQHHLGLVIANKAKSVTDDDKLTHHQAFILTIAGATVGFGATWRFPYLVGENGGGAYVFLFCIAMLVIGIPMILVENVIGRRKGVNALDAFGGPMNGKPIAKIWKLVGWMGCSARSASWLITWCSAAGLSATLLISSAVIWTFPVLFPAKSPKVSLPNTSKTVLGKLLSTPSYLWL